MFNWVIQQLLGLIRDDPERQAWCTDDVQPGRLAVMPSRRAWTYMGSADELVLRPYAVARAENRCQEVLYAEGTTGRSISAAVAHHPACRQAIVRC